MEKWRWARCESALKEYNEIDGYIKKIERDIRTPHRESDINSDIKGTKVDNDTMFNTVWTIETHKAINQLKKKKDAIGELLDECGKDTETIIRELYINKFPQFTLNGLVRQNKLSCGRNKAIELRAKFFFELDKKLDI